MSERKVLNKYYPPDYDPSKVPRIKKKDRQTEVRMMAPFNLRCNTCGNYIANATKFNAKKEKVEDTTYNNILIFRFYIKCPRCMSQIIIRTNPKEQGYEVESGATENFMALKMAERQAREEAEADEEEEKINPMKHLENRTRESKKQMEASEQIQNLRSIKHRHNSIDLESVLQDKRKEIATTSIRDHPDRDEDDEIRAEARRLLKRKEIETGDRISSLKPSSSAHSVKISTSLSNLKQKKIKIIPKSSAT